MCIRDSLPSEDTYGFYDDYSAYANDATSLLKLASRESQNTDANAILLKDGTMTVSYTHLIGFCRNV